jgi:hypothetical protein
VQRQRVGGQDLGDRVVADRPSEALPADRGDLPQAERRVFGLELDDRLADPERQAALVRRRRVVRLEQTAHPGRRETGHLALQGPLGDAGLVGTFAGQLAKQDDRAHEFVGGLFGGGDEETQLPPVVGRLATWARGCRHRSSLDECHPRRGRPLS